MADQFGGIPIGEEVAADQFGGVPMADTAPVVQPVAPVAPVDQGPDYAGKMADLMDRYKKGYGLEIRARVADRPSR